MSASIRKDRIPSARNSRSQRPHLLADLRKAKGLTLDQVAARMGTKKSNVSVFETGRERSVSDAFVQRYAKALGVGKQAVERGYWRAVSADARRRLKQAREALGAAPRR